MPPSSTSHAYSLRQQIAYYQGGRPVSSFVDRLTMREIGLLKQAFKAINDAAVG
jgi:hypothetical protein